jgi:hypothetical protein
MNKVLLHTSKVISINCICHTGRVVLIVGHNLNGEEFKFKLPDLKFDHFQIGFRDYI